MQAAWILYVQIFNVLDFIRSNIQCENSIFFKKKITVLVLLSGNKNFQTVISVLNSLFDS